MHKFLQSNKKVTLFVLTLQLNANDNDRAPCNFYLFPKVKSALKGIILKTVESMNEKQDA